MASASNDEPPCPLPHIFSETATFWSQQPPHIFYPNLCCVTALQPHFWSKRPPIHQHLRVTASWAASFAVTGSCSPAISAAADPPMVSSLRSRTRSCQRAKGGKPGGATGRGTAPWGKVERRWWIKMDRMMYFLSWRMLKIERLWLTSSKLICGWDLHTSCVRFLLIVLLEGFFILIMGNGLYNKVMPCVIKKELRPLSGIGPGNAMFSNYWVHP